MIKQVGQTPIQPEHLARCHCGTVVLALALPNGSYTHHQRRSNPSEFGFNIACLDGVNPFELENIPVMDGIHHPADR